MKKLAVLGGSSGLIGPQLIERASSEYQVKVYSRPEFNVMLPKTMLVLGRVIQRTRPDVFILSARGPINEKNQEAAFAQEEALKILWPVIKELDLTLIIMSSAGGWKVGERSSTTIMKYREAKQRLSTTAIDLCWRSSLDSEHLARTILFEPSIMNPEVAKQANLPYLSVVDAWNLLKAGIDSRVAFLRLGCQGADINT